MEETKDKHEKTHTAVPSNAFYLFIYLFLKDNYIREDANRKSKKWRRKMTNNQISRKVCIFQAEYPQM